MSKLNCDACSNLREYAPDFVNNGVTEEICTSLKNDTGLNPKLTTQHTNCDDLHDANDCLIGNMPNQLEAYDVCDWKEFMIKLLPNLYEMLKAMICALCGVYDKIRCLNDNMKKIVKALGTSETYQPVVTSPRSNGSGVDPSGHSYYRPASDDYEIAFYMDSVHGDDGSKVADKDYACIISCCCDTGYANSGDMYHCMTYHTSSVPFSVELQNEYGLHLREYIGASGENSTPLTASCYVKKGDYLKLHVGDEGYNNSGQFRVHQFIITWIPIFSVDFSTDGIKDC